jgi:hypothetical protein
VEDFEDNFDSFVVFEAFFKVVYIDIVVILLVV